MKTLREIRHSEIVSNARDKTPATFHERHAARAVVTADNGKIALLYVGKYRYHKLPGGGVEDGEDIKQALARELLEEIGCQAEVTAELGKIVEYRDEWDMKQTSYCYLATKTGEAGLPDFTEKELSEGFSIVWAKDIAEAIKLLEHDRPENYGGRFIRERDLEFLTAAQKAQYMQNFTQKYTIIQLLEDLPEGAQFSVNSWPLHTTIADTFAIDWDIPTMVEKLTELLNSHTPAASVVEDDAFFGNDGQVRVALLKKTNDLVKLHYAVIECLKQGGWKPNCPQFALDGFLPHSTVQKHARLNKDDKVTFDALTIIDMFPGGDPYQRKVIKTVASRK